MARASHDRIESRESRSLIYVPRRAGPHRVLCFLHGAGESAESGSRPFDKLLSHRSPAWHAQNGSAAVRDFVILCPQLEKRRRWETTDAPRLDALVRAAAQDHDGDLSRLVLSGFSLGGEGAFQVASASGFFWYTIWAVDPALQRLPPCPAPNVRVLIHHGVEQPGGANMSQFAAALGLVAWAGTPSAPRVLRSLGRDHSSTCRAAFADAAAYDWLVR